MYYVIGANGSQYGPVDEATIRAWVAEGRVAAPSLSFKTGESGWVPLQTREEFRDLLAAAPASPVTAAPRPPPPPRPPRLSGHGGARHASALSRPAGPARAGRARLAHNSAALDLLGMPRGGPLLSGTHGPR